MFTFIQVRTIVRYISKHSLISESNFLHRRVPDVGKSKTNCHPTTKFFNSGHTKPTRFVAWALHYVAPECRRLLGNIETKKKSTGENVKGFVIREGGPRSIVPKWNRWHL